MARTWLITGASAMRVAPDCQQTGGAMNRRRADFDRTAPGDPARAARIIVDLVRLEEPPLRLLLGAGAVEAAERSSRTRAAEAERWAEVSRSADFPPGEQQPGVHVDAASTP